MLKMNGALVAMAMMLGACGSQADQPVTANEAVPAAAEPIAAPVALPTDAWVGKWVGVEGLFLEIAKAAAPGQYAVRVGLLDGVNDYTGVADGATIRIDRGPEGATIRAATGAETGLKYLAEKKDCLMIVSGEGFCRG